ncbi:hypothetical protein GCM10010924_52170 [Rhizobium wenxiniae]|nr:hypothetical protein GCM10010924_52170 [Rhizobium wenxiniae]
MQERSGGRRTGTASTYVEDGEAVAACIRLLQDRDRDGVASDARDHLSSFFPFLP